MIDTCINRDDIRRYVHDTLPWVKTSEWDIDAIADDVIEAWPALIGQHPDLLDAAGPDRELQWLDSRIDADVYWPVVARHCESHAR